MSFLRSFLQLHHNSGSIKNKTGILCVCVFVPLLQLIDNFNGNTAGGVEH
jgi:hypothetical protein